MNTIATHMPRIGWIVGTIMLALVTAAGDAAAQRAPSPFGRRFIVGFPRMTIPTAPMLSTPVRPDVRLIIFSSQPADVSITMAGYRRNVKVTAGASTVVSLLDPSMTAPKIFFDRVGTAARDLFEVTSNVDISLYCYFVSIAGTEAYSPLPVERWGTSYMAMTGNATTVSDVQMVGDERLNHDPYTAPAQALVIAAENGTQVTVDARGLASARLAGTGGDVRTVTLQAGEGYLVETRTDFLVSSFDLSGLRITATKPIGVVSGNTRIGDLLPLTGNTTRNCVYEWLAPTDAGGTTFVYRSLLPRAVPNAGVPMTEVVRVYATAPGSTRVSSTITGAMTVPQGSFREFRPVSTALPFAIATDKPAQAMVFSASYAQDVTASIPGADFTTYDTWGSTMSRMIPQEQWINRGRFHSPTHPSLMTHAVSIVAEAGTQMTLDGQPVTFFNTQVTGTGFLHVWIAVPAGDHILAATRGRFAAVAFGQMHGFELYRPPIAKKDEVPSPLHPSEYDEMPGVTYSYPVTGTQESAEAPAEAGICARAKGGVTVTNSGSDALDITTAAVIDPTGAFRLGTVAFPIRMQPGASGLIPVDYNPAAGSATKAMLRYTIRSSDGRRSPVEMETVLTAAEPTTVAAAFHSPFPATPGDTVTMPLVLEDSLDDSFVTGFEFRLTYDTLLIKLVNGDASKVATMIDSTTRLKGWTIRLVRNVPGEFIAALTAPPGKNLSDTGTLMKFRFATFLRLVDSADLTWKDSADLAFSFMLQSRLCTEVAGDPGVLRLELCGLRHRLFELGDTTYALLPNRPNPFNPSTEINFSLGLDGPTRLDILDAGGRLVTTLIDRHLPSGGYVVTWDATAYPSGMYYYRLVSGDWSRTGSMILTK